MLYLLKRYTIFPHRRQNSLFFLAPPLHPESRIRKITLSLKGLKCSSTQRILEPVHRCQFNSVLLVTWCCYLYNITYGIGLHCFWIWSFHTTYSCPCPGIEFVNNINQSQPGSPPNLSMVRSRSKQLSIIWKVPLSSNTNKAEEKAYGIKHTKKNHSGHTVAEQLIGTATSGKAYGVNSTLHITDSWHSA